jgi:hypothetical protein
MTLVCMCIYRVFRVQADWTVILLSELPPKELGDLTEKNAAAQHHVLRSLISLHSEHHVCMYVCVHSFLE